MKSTILLYEDKPKYDLWMKFLLAGIPAVTLITGLATKNIDITGTWVLLGTTAFIGLLFWAILPRSYQIYEDRFRIQLGAPFGLNIPLASIQQATKATGYYAFAYWGIRFATSTSNVVEIKRRQGMNVIISPSNVDDFLEQLSQAQKSLQDSN
jgi:hypothetical protein